MILLLFLILSTLDAIRYLPTLKFKELPHSYPSPTSSRIDGYMIVFNSFVDYPYSF